MHILIGIVLALALLYFWLIGHWFARIVMLPVWAAILGGGLALLLASADHAGQNNGIFGLLMGICLAWPAASAPIYYWRWRIREIEREEAAEAAAWEARKRELLQPAPQKVKQEPISPPVQPTLVRYRQPIDWMPILVGCSAAGALIVVRLSIAMH